MCTFAMLHSFCLVCPVQACLCGSARLCHSYATDSGRVGACVCVCVCVCAPKVIKRFIMHSKKTAFIVEHDFIMATYLADRVIVYEGVASKHATANTPTTLQLGKGSRHTHAPRMHACRRAGARTHTQQLGVP